MFEVGFGRSDITVYEPGLCMLGWGHPENIARGVATPLYARAMVVADPVTGSRLAYVCADLCFISTLIRRGVIDRLQERHAELGFDEQNVMLTATHTHSGPSGYSHYFFYALAAPGFSPLVYETLVAGLTSAIVEAAKHRRPGRLWLHQGDVPLSSAVAFNRSVFAYNSNPEVTPLTWKRRDEAIDRTMRLLRADDSDGVPLGMISWFGVHGTSIHRDNTLIHGDHKGLAALDVERWARQQSSGGPPFVAMFPQAAAADVTPNFRYDRRRGFEIGRYDDDFRNAEECAAHQSRRARELFERAPLDGQELEGALRSALRYEPMVGRPIDPDLAGGRTDCVTTPVRIGLGSLEATAEGPLPLWPVRHLLRTHTTATRALKSWQRAILRSDGPEHDPKHIISRHDRLLGMSWAGPVLSSIPGRMGSAFKRIAEQDGPPGPQLAPEVLPAQLFGLGAFWIAAVPCEITTIAARRVRGTVERVVERHTGPRTTVVVNSMANAYASYCTTPEEYVHQHYEAGSTLFGRWTVAAYQGTVRRLAHALVEGTPIDSGSPPLLPTPAQLERLRFRAVQA